MSTQKKIVGALFLAMGLGTFLAALFSCLTFADLWVHGKGIERIALFGIGGYAVVLVPVAIGYLSVVFRRQLREIDWYCGAGVVLASTLVTGATIFLVLAAGRKAPGPPPMILLGPLLAFFTLGGLTLLLLWRLDQKGQRADA